jgi:phytoene synthase
MAHTGSGVAARGSVTRALTKASRSNFYYAFLFLPRQKREALYAIYAFCRLTDDLVDEMPSAFSADHHHQADPDPSPSTDTSVGVARAPGTPLERLKAWRAELGACFRGEATHPVTQRLAEVNQDLRIPQSFFEELLDGVEMDLTKSRYATYTELQQYCHRVAGVVGLMCIKAFGYRHPATQQYAEDLGTAFQLTNILRDLAADAERGRIYLPQEDLLRFGYAEEDLVAGRMTPAFLDLMRFEAERARGFYARAQATLPAEDRRNMLAAEIMRAIYARILDRIEGAGFDVFSRRIRLSDRERFCLAASHWLKHLLRFP